jgi:hypothetical protein
MNIPDQHRAPRRHRRSLFTTAPAAGPVVRALGVVVICLASNCSSASVLPGASVDTPAPAAAERVIVRADFGHIVNVRAGDAIVARPPMDAAEWQVAFDKSFLEYQGTAETLHTPGAGGWTFHAVRAGDTSLTLTPISRGANPPRFTVTLRIEP